MATAAQLRLDQGEQAIVDFEPIWLQGSPYDLTTVTLTAYIKPTATTPDDDPSVVVITQTAGADGVITIADAASGIASLTIAGTVLAEPGTLAWRLDATDESGAVGRIAYGPIYVEADGDD
jgi:hypothetical protein